MKEVFLFWLCLEAIGVAAFPVVFAFFGRLPDRGYAFSKVIGLLLVGYLLWMTATLGLLPNNRGAIILLLLVVAGVSLALAGSRREELAGFLRRGRHYILAVEGLFALVFVAGAFLRSYAPDIIWGEKPFELAFLNAANRAEFFPPHDPWLSGQNISYYYFGYLQASILTKLSALGTNTTFFLMLCALAALASSVIFGLVYNLVCVAEIRRLPQFGVALSHRFLRPRPLFFGLATVFLLLFVSNLEGVFELLARYGIGSHTFFSWVGINELPRPYDCTSMPADCADWFPTRWWWWWKATRMSSLYDIQEFPFFSFQFGDLHPHVLAMPSLLVGLGATLHLLSDRDERYDWAWWMRRPRSYLFLGLLLGGTFFIDLWTLPILAALLLVAAALSSALREQRLEPLRLALDAASFAISVLFLAIVLYLPLFLTTGGGVSGIGPNEAIVAQANGVPPLGTAVTRPVHYLIFWLPVIWLPLSFLVNYLWRAGSLSRRLAYAALAPGLAVLLVWGVCVLGRDGLGAAGTSPNGLLGEIDLRWDAFNWITVAMLLAFVALSLLALLRELARPLEERRQTVLLALAASALAFVLVLGAEFFSVEDRLGMRLNTVFRFWYQAWLLLVVAGGFGLYYLTREWRPRIRLTAPSALAIGWSGVSLCLLGGALVYTVLVVFNRTNAFDNPYRSLDGLSFVQRTDTAEYDALRWLNTAVSGSPTILEAQGTPYSDYGRVSSRTGLPTVLGWATHEFQWRGSYDLVKGRPEDIVEIYTTSDNEEAQRLLRKYNVQYVYIGRLERTLYIDQAPAGQRAAREQALYKFGQFMDLAFQEGALRIYKLRETSVLTEAFARS
ncbi:MAG TPA: DUF2298 domain-containing protein [Dehalococcoidia bacterium]|nr:DUF2298 domain-containing protein [Dehalococcoidia bacterium]